MILPPWLAWRNDLGKDTVAMQHRAKANHDLRKDAKINHVLDKGSMVANPFFWNSQYSKPCYPCQDPCSRSPLYTFFPFCIQIRLRYSLDVIPGHHGIPGLHAFIDMPADLPTRGEKEAFQLRTQSTTENGSIKYLI